MKKQANISLYVNSLAKYVFSMFNVDNEISGIQC